VSVKTKNIVEHQESMIQQLKVKLRNAHKLICKGKKTILKLKQKNKKEVYDKKSKMDKFLRSNMIARSEFRLGQLKKSAKRYKETEKSFALGLYYHSPVGYTFMKSYLNLPAVRSLRRWLQGLDVSCGINENILNILSLKFKTAPIKERLVSIIMDEMSLKKLISYNSQNDIFTGFEDYGSNIFENQSSLKHGNQALVIMIKSLVLPWKQILGFFVSCGPVSGDRLKQIMIHTIQKLIECGLIPKVIICDQGSNNMKMRKLFGVTMEKPYITYNNENIFFIHDPPHLLKSVRNNLKKYTFTNRQESYCWKDIEDFYYIDSKIKPRLASKLKKIHIELPPFSPMRVCLAAQTFSNSVSAGILTLVSFNRLNNKSTFTAKFVKFFNDLFDCFNSIKMSESVVLKRPITRNSKHWSFLEEAQIFLSTLKVNNKRKNIPPCILGWQENINCIKLLYNELNIKYEIDYLLTRRLTQDCIECLFSILRSKGGNNVTPDASKFFSAIRMSMCNMLINPSNNANCEKDASKFLALSKDLRVKNKVQLHKLADSDFDFSNNYEDFLSNMNINYIHMDNETANGVAYITGWVCSQLTHKACIEKLASSNKSENSASFNIDNTLINMKEYDDCNLLYPFTKTLEFTKHITALFNSSIEELLFIKKENIKRDQKILIKTICKRYTLNICENCEDTFVEKYLNVSINSYVKKCNDSSVQYKYLNNKKLKKITHI